jgi:hypothetical protein
VIEVLRSPAELGAMGFAVVATPVAWWLADRRWVVQLLAAAPLALGVAAALFRSVALGSATSDYGARYVVGFAVHRAGEAGVGLAVGSVAAAVVYLAGAGPWRSASPGGWAWVAAALLAAGGALSGGVGWLAVAAAAALVAPGRPASVPSFGTSASLLVVAAVAAVSAEWAGAASLYDAADGGALAPLGAAVGLALIGAVVAFVSREAGPAPLALSPAFTLGLVVTAASTLAPPPELGALAGELPIAVVAEPFRVAYGCLVHEGRVLALSGAGVTPACPADVASFPAGRRPFPPLFALGPEAPLSALAPAAGGEAALLVRLPGLGFARWRVVQVEVPVFGPPGEGGEAPTNVLVLRPGDPVPVLRSAARTDVVVPLGPATDVASFLAICAEVHASAGPATRCGVGVGGPGAW